MSKKGCGKISLHQQSLWKFRNLFIVKIKCNLAFSYCGMWRTHNSKIVRMWCEGYESRLYGRGSIRKC